MRSSVSFLGLALFTAFSFTFTGCGGDEPFVEELTEEEIVAFEEEVYGAEEEDEMDEDEDE